MPDLQVLTFLPRKGADASLDILSLSHSPIQSPIHSNFSPLTPSSSPPQAYDCLFPLNLEWPALSFAFLEPRGAPRKSFPFATSIAVGTQVARLLPLPASSPPSPLALHFACFLSASLPLASSR